MIKQIFLFGFFIFAFNYIEHFAHKKTDGFTLSRVQFDRPIEQKEPIRRDELGQTFHYLGCGNQCFAFISEDGNYVLKLFKYANPPIPRVLTKVPILKRFKPFRKNRFERMLWKRERDFRGYQLAYDHFRQETGLLDAHLEPTDHNYPTITLYDKLRCRHQLDLNHTPFVLQKRATAIYPQLQEWMASGQTDVAKSAVAKLFALLKKRIELNLMDDDVHFYSNFGFVGETPVQVDPGHFIQGKTPNPDLEMSAITEELITWCEKFAPELL